MEFKKWNKWYEEILNDFNFSKDDDERTADVLNEIIEENGFLTVEDLKKEFPFKKAVVFGAGPSLKKHINKIKENLDEYCLISADGATTALLEEKIIPNIIATDLDGNIDDLLLANNKGSFMVIHAHGNNLNEIIRYVPFFDNVLGTTQSKAHSNLYNFGGFTDGDRAIFLAVALGIHEVVLAGMDFGDIVTKYSRPNLSNNIAPADEFKKKKLKYAERLTNWIKENENIKLINLK